MEIAQYNSYAQGKQMWTICIFYVVVPYRKKGRGGDKGKTVILRDHKLMYLSLFKLQWLAKKWAKILKITLVKKQLPGWTKNNMKSKKPPVIIATTTNTECLDITIVKILINQWDILN